jgi:F1F0 ATPase subunit 2
MTTSISHLLLAFVAGVGIGVIFFGGLWWTVRRLGTVESPARLTLASFFVRTGVALVALYFVMGGEWERLIAALLGMVVIRFLLVRRLRPQETVNSNQ